jgi:uncharacterized delta-60 repeat protein
VAIQSDGKIVADGFAVSGGADVFALVRYDTLGHLDTGFGPSHDGTVTTPVGDGSSSAANAIALDGSQILAVGGAFTGANDDFAAARYNADGSLDTAFGSGGKVDTPFAGVDAEATAVAIQSDGKVVLVGRSGGFLGLPPYSAQFALARYSATGTLDTTFGSGGQVQTSLGDGSDAEARAAAIQSDGKIVAAGFAKQSSPDGVTDNFAVARYAGDQGGGPGPTPGDNKPKLDSPKLDKKHGTATIPVEVSGAGALELTGKDVKTVDQQAAAAGTEQLAVTPTGKLKKKLKKKGKASVTVTVSFTPTGGTAGTATDSVSLKRKVKKPKHHHHH